MSVRASLADRRRTCGLRLVAVARPGHTGPLEVLIATCWLAALADPAGEGLRRTLTGAGTPEAMAATTAGIGAMSLAMMLPAALPAVSHVARHSLPRRRRPAMAEFVTVYVALWTIAAAVELALLAAPGVARRFDLPLALAVAALWQLTAAKRRALRACHRSWPLPPSGPSATRGVVHFAAGHGGACLASCWALMAVALVAPAPGSAWMLGLTLVIVAERIGPRPRLATRASAAALGLAAIAAVAIS